VSSGQSRHDAVMRRTCLCIALVLRVAGGCSNHAGAPGSVGSSSSPSPQTSADPKGSPSPPCPHHQGHSTGVASQRSLDHHIDAPPERYDPPGDAKPTIDADTALRLSEQRGFPIGNPVDAVLATLTTQDRGSALVWALTVTDEEVQPSLGPTICADVAKIVDATTGELLYGLKGTTVESFR